MDIYCHKCGEPWEVTTLGDWAKESGRTYDQVRETFYRDGCSALYSARCNPNTTAHPAIAALQDILGDDVDGMAAELEDFGIGGML